MTRRKSKYMLTYRIYNVNLQQIKNSETKTAPDITLNCKNFQFYKKLVKWKQKNFENFENLPRQKYISRANQAFLVHSDTGLRIPG